MEVRTKWIAAIVVVTWLTGSASAEPPALEPATQKFIDGLAAKGGPPIFKLSPKDARDVLSSLQTGKVSKPRTDTDDRTLPVGPDRKTRVRIYRPLGIRESLPVVMYFHGGGWILGDRETHDRLVREIANGAHAAVVFVDYDRSPEAKYPVAIEQAYEATRYIAEHGQELRLDPSRMAVAGDSVGGNMAAVVAILAEEHGGPSLKLQVLLYPVTDANFETASYKQFANGPWLTKPAMQWFWDAYLPDASKRKDPHVSPLRASLDQLHALPPALVITDENDVLRDEGEAYAHKLAEAGVPVTAMRVLGTIHDFMMLNALAETPPARGAMDLTNQILRKALAR